MIEYVDDLSDVRAGDVGGFFVGWPRAPSAERFLELLRGSHAVVLARDSESRRVVGFVSAISDGVLSAPVPLLEVLPEFQRQGIGQELMRRMLEKLEGFAMVDLTCDPELEPYYERFGMIRVSGMVIRNRDAL